MNFVEYRRYDILSKIIENLISNNYNIWNNNNQQTYKNEERRKIDVILGKFG